LTLFLLYYLDGISDIKWEFFNYEDYYYKCGVQNNKPHRVIIKIERIPKIISNSNDAIGREKQTVIVKRSCLSTYKKTIHYGFLWIFSFNKIKVDSLLLCTFGMYRSGPK
jgi:hypothetical protein